MRCSFFPNFSKPVLVIYCFFLSTGVNTIRSFPILDSYRLGVRLAVIFCVRLCENSLCRQELGYLLTILSVSLTRYPTPPYRECFLSHYLGIASSEYKGSFVKAIDGRVTVGFFLGTAKLSTVLTLVLGN